MANLDPNSTLIKILTTTETTLLKVEAIDKRTERHDKILYGTNSKEGLVTNVDRLVQGEKRDREKKKRHIGFYIAGWSALLSTLVIIITKIIDSYVSHH